MELLKKTLEKSGVVRGDNGIWLEGISWRLGMCTACQAKMWGIISGMELAWRENYKFLLVESDSLSLMERLHDHKIQGNMICPLWHRIAKLEPTMTHIEFCHTFKERYRCADKLANHNLSSQSYDMQTREAPHGELPWWYYGCHHAPISSLYS